jgi:phosphotriesterase-related protein
MLRDTAQDQEKFLMPVTTVLGPVSPQDLGVMQPHEHVLVDLRHSLSKFDAILDDVELAADELRAFREAGGRTIIDMTNARMGRDVTALKEISAASGVHIVASTGYYTVPYYGDDVYRLTINDLAEILVHELTVGIGDTGIRAGIIAEIGTGRDFINPAEERVFRAAARAHQRTGAAIYTHTYLEQLLLEQLAILKDENVDLRRVAVGHLGDFRDLRRVYAVAEQGAFLGIDHIGMAVQQTDRQRARSVAQLVRDGFAHQILLSLDLCQKSRLHWYGGTGYDYLLNQFVPLLREEGVDDEIVNLMMVENPRRFLAPDA